MTSRPVLVKNGTRPKESADDAKGDNDAQTSNENCIKRFKQLGGCRLSHLQSVRSRSHNCKCLPDDNESMNDRGDEPQLLLPFKHKVDYEVSPRSASTATTKTIYSLSSST
jgi:hypothetical protein